MRIARLESRSPRDRPAIVLVLLVTLALVLAPAAAANIGETIILRCTHEQSLAGFSQSAYRQALKELSADTEEYSDCSSLIRQAQQAAAGGHGGASGLQQSAATPTSITATPAEQSAITQAKHAGSGPVTVAGHLIEPGVVHANIASAFSSLPTPLLATVAFLLVCLLLLAASAIRNRVRGERPS